MSEVPLKQAMSHPQPLRITGRRDVRRVGYAPCSAADAPDRSLAGWRCIALPHARKLTGLRRGGTREPARSLSSTTPLLHSESGPVFIQHNASRILSGSTYRYCGSPPVGLKQSCRSSSTAGELAGLQRSGMAGTFTKAVMANLQTKVWYNGRCVSSF